MTAGELLIRELTPGDRHALSFAYRQLGGRSRQQRFLGAKPALRPADLERLVHVDHWHHEALIAFSSSPRAPLGVAEYVRLERFDTAELAIAVVDEWQGRGVGGALLAALRSRALAAGIRRFTALTMRGNRGALALARQLGPFTVVSVGLGIAEVAAELSS